MLLSEIVFVSLIYQPNRKAMFKKAAPNPQLDMFTAPSMRLGSRASKKRSPPTIDTYYLFRRRHVTRHDSLVLRKREMEYDQSKIALSMEMIRRAIRRTYLSLASYRKKKRTTKTHITIW